MTICIVDTSIVVELLNLPGLASRHDGLVAEFEQRRTWSDRLANKVAETNGSWAFILCLVAMTSV